MSRSRCVLGLILPVLCVLLPHVLLPHQAAAISLPDTTVVDTTLIYDKADKFRLTGTLTTIDRTDPPDGIFDDNEIAIYDGVHWFFSYLDVNLGWQIPPSILDNGSWATFIEVSGRHNIGPHPTGPDADQDPNSLTFIRSSFANIPFPDPNAAAPDAPVSLTVSRHTPHVTSSKPHYDVYSFRHEISLFQGPPHMVTGPFEIVAKHVTAKADSIISHELVMGSSAGSGAHISYDAGNGTLALHMGTLDILNSTGLLSPGIETAYLTDPIRNVLVPDLILPFLGVTIDGAFRFGGGILSTLDPEGELSVKGGFPEYRIRDTSLSGTLNSYAILDSVLTLDQGACPSAFINDFSRVNLLGANDPEWGDTRGVGLAFVTAQNLATLTAGFTLSALNVPATIVLTGARNVAAVSGVSDRPEDGASPAGHNFPNPFLSRTTIRYRVAQPGAVRIEIFGPTGRLVRRLTELPTQAPGEYNVDWDGTTDDGVNASAGVYFYRVTVGPRRYSKEMILVR